MGFWPIVENVIRNSDILLLILDARMPELSRNKEIERKILSYGKEMVYVFNKIDLVSEENLIILRKEYKDAFFVSATKNIGIGRLRKYLHILSKRIKADGARTGVVGYPNIGKSAVINVIARRAKTEVSDKPGTTRGAQWVRAGGLEILDSPGVIPYEDKSLKLTLIGSKSPDKIKDPEKVALEIVQMFISKNKKNLEERYKILIPPVMDHTDILIEIGRKRGFLKRGGEADERKTAISIIRDWQKGRLKI